MRISLNDQILVVRTPTSTTRTRVGRRVIHQATCNNHVLDPKHSHQSHLTMHIATQMQATRAHSDMCSVKHSTLVATTIHTRLRALLVLCWHRTLLVLRWHPSEHTATKYSDALRVFTGPNPRTLTLHAFTGSNPRFDMPADDWDAVSNEAKDLVTRPPPLAAPAR